MKVLNLLLLAKECVENEEGEVITMSDGQMMKCKNSHYLQLHSLIGPDSYRENILIRTIISGNIDDVIAALVPGEKKDKIVAMDEKVTQKFNSLVRELFSLGAEYYNFHNEDRKSFALMYSPKGTNPNELFSTYMKNCREPLTEKVAEDAIKVYIETRCNSLGKAKEFVEGL